MLTQHLQKIRGPNIQVAYLSVRMFTAENFTSIKFLLLKFPETNGSGSIVNLSNEPG